MYENITVSTRYAANFEVIRGPRPFSLWRGAARRGAVRPGALDMPMADATRSALTAYATSAERDLAFNGMS